MNNKIKKYILEELNKSDKYSYKVFKYLKELEERKDDLKLQKAIWNLCEATEFVSNVIVSLEVLENEQL